MVSENLSQQAWYVSLWRCESPTQSSELWLRLVKCQTGIYDIWVMPFIAGSHPYDMHEIVEISDKMWVLDIFDECNVLVLKKNPSYINGCQIFVRTNNFDSIIDG